MSSQRLLLTPLYGMGDVLMTTPTLRRIREARPDWHIALCAMHAGTAELFRGHPLVDQIIHLPQLLNHPLSGVWEILRQISGRYDLSLTFHPSNRSAYNLFALLSGCRRRIGHRYTRMDFSQLNWLRNHGPMEDLNLHCVQQNWALLAALGIEDRGVPGPMELALTPMDLQIASQQLPPRHRPRIGIHAGSSALKAHIHRRWPPEHFAELIALRPDLEFFLFGAGAEIQANQQIIQLSGAPERCHLIHGHNLRLTGAILGQMDAMVSNDSGLMHLAAAAGTPIVTVLGPTNPTFIHPWAVPHRVVRLELPCSPCFFYSPKPLSCAVDGQFHCLRDIPAQMVSEALDDLRAESHR